MTSAEVILQTIANAYLTGDECCQRVTERLQLNEREG